MFVNRTPTAQSVTALSVLSELSRQRPPPGPLLPAVSWMQTLRFLKRLLVNPDCPPTLFRAQAAEVFRGLYLPKETRPCTGPTPYDWLLSVCRSTVPSAALDHALLAFAAVHIYVGETGSAAVPDCFSLYDRALQLVREDVNDPGKRTKFETLGAIVTLSTGEVCPYS